MKETLIIKAKVLYDGNKKAENKYIVIKDDRIHDIGSRTIKAQYEGYVTPAYIDAHSHIGMAREGEPSAEEEGNDISHQIAPLNNPLDSVYFDDRAFKDSVDFGVLYSCIVPGSGNILGGKAIVIKNHAINRTQALVIDYGYKMALGYNPRSTTEWKGPRPNTRMGLNALLENRFDELLTKK